MTINVSNRIGDACGPASDGRTFERTNPADRREVVAVAPESTAGDVAAAVEAAAAAAGAWRRTTPTRRAEILTGAAALLAARADVIAGEMVAEEGKPLGEATAEASRTPRNLELYAGEAYTTTRTIWLGS